MKRALTVEEVAMILQKSIDVVMKFAKLIAAMFPLRGDENGDDAKLVFSVFHKSVFDWITDEERSYNFYIVMCVYVYVCICIIYMCMRIYRYSIFKNQVTNERREM